MSTAIDTASARNLHKAPRSNRRQRIVRANCAAFIAGFACIFIWIQCLLILNTPLGFMKLPIGILLGYLVRVMGESSAESFGRIAALHCFAICAIGDIATGILHAKHLGQKPLSVFLSTLDPESLRLVLKEHLSIYDLGWYFAALLASYQLARWRHPRAAHD